MSPATQLTHRSRIIFAAFTLAACATTPTESSGVRLRLASASQSAPADANALFLEGEIVNSGSEPFVSGGCTRPTIVIDSLGTRGWVPLDVAQFEELIACIRPFTVDPGRTATFQAVLTRPRIGLFPTGVLLRARIPVGASTDGPSAEFVLRR